MSITSHSHTLWPNPYLMSLHMVPSILLWNTILHCGTQDPPHSGVFTCTAVLHLIGHLRSGNNGCISLCNNPENYASFVAPSLSPEARYFREHHRQPSTNSDLPRLRLNTRLGKYHIPRQPTFSRLSLQTPNWPP